MGTGNTIKLHRVDELQTVYIPSCPEKKDGRGRVKGKGNQFRSRGSPARPLSFAGRTVSAWREAAWPRTWPAVPAARSACSALARAGGHRPHRKRTEPAHVLGSALRSSRGRARRPGPCLLKLGPCHPRPDLHSLHLSAESGFFSFFVSSHQIFALPRPIYCQVLARREERGVRRSEGAEPGKRARRRNRGAGLRRSGSDGQGLVMSKLASAELCHRLLSSPAP